jgi:hypothetical protein
MKKSNDRARVRVFFGEFEGDNDTIRDGLRSIAEAVKQTFKQEQRTVKLIAASPDVDPKQLAAMVDEQVIDIETIEQGDEDTAESVTNGAKARAPRAKKPSTYSLVKDLNFRPKEKQALREFFDEKKPSDQQHQLTVIMYYLYRILEIEGITPNHVFTALKHLGGIRVPNDIAGTLRAIASRKGYLDTSNTEDLKTTTEGDNLVEHDLPATD